MTQITLAGALPYINCSHLWNLDLPEADAARAWRELGLPDSHRRWREIVQRYFSERISMEASHYPDFDTAALGEELERICQLLELSWEGVRLPWHHVSALCEILAYAVERGEPDIAAALARDYLLPWCEAVEREAIAEQPELTFLTEKFAQDLMLRVGEADGARS